MPGKAVVYIHERHLVHTSCTGNPYVGDLKCSSSSSHPSWEDPAAVPIGIGGLSIAAGVLTFRRRFTNPS